MNVIDELKNDAAGLALLKDWLGAGGNPVSKSLASSRAAVCLGCTLNKSPRWWEKAKGTIAEVIRHQLAIRARMDLSLSLDDHLNMCSACGCSTRLKVFTPIEHIVSHTPPETIQKFAPQCWILKELQEVLPP